MDPSRLFLGKGLVLPNLNIDQIAKHVRILLISLESDEMSKKSPFSIHKATIGIGGEPKSVKRLRSGNLLLEFNCANQTKSFLYILAKSFLDSPVNISTHKSLNTSRGDISESDLLTTPKAEILYGFSGQGEEFSLTLPKTIRAGYLNYKIRPCIPKHLRYFKCQRFVHSVTACRGQLTRPRWACWTCLLRLKSGAEMRLLSTASFRRFKIMSQIENRKRDPNN
ncbi:uncharacterized protein TNCV_3111141 [Trichonephila clavipes]|nr:uncharacterized protein TNCV_3111141 [Trichonephila clavipes]